ncbi:unnamed protein product [Rotaria sordida]|uniref:Uncharacterized protein n=1 Tax=Rotaria sordida TaxID=392033 RepID=A0A815AFU4_9BILA|nr:unnamed protein product [Rotaria sordida]CAF1257049.1 unnamed protein product [Rotaria sordida]
MISSLHRNSIVRRLLAKQIKKVNRNTNLKLPIVLVKLDSDQTIYDVSFYEHLKQHSNIIGVYTLVDYQQQ